MRKKNGTRECADGAVQRAKKSALPKKKERDSQKKKVTVGLNIRDFTIGFVKIGFHRPIICLESSKHSKMLSCFLKN